MSSSTLPRALSALSLSSTQSTTASESEQEDWDRSLVSSEPFSVLDIPAQPSTPTREASASGPTARVSKEAESEAEAPSATPTHHRNASTPRNSVVFPGPSELYTPSFSPGRPTRFSTTSDAKDSNLGKAKGRRTLSELLRLHSEKGCEGKFSAEEAARIADVLGQWINASSSPYEPAEDDFFLPSGAMDDLSPTLTSKKSSLPPQLRPRGRSESASSLSLSSSLGNSSNSRPPSSTGFLGVSS